MRIGIDARLGFGDPTGLGTYTRRVVSALAAVDGGNEYVLYTDRPPPNGDAGGAGGAGALPPNFRVRVVPGRNRIAWTNARIPPRAAEDRLDLYHGLANFELPLRFPGLKVVTVHDLVPLHMPAAVPWKHRLLFRLLQGEVLRRADRVLAVSDHTRRDVIEHYGVPEDRIEVMLNWVDDSFGPGRGGAVARRLGLGEAPFVFTGVLEPKKNLDRLLAAFAAVGGTHPDARLAITGSAGWFTDHLRDEASRLGVAERVVFTGFLPEADLVDLLRGAGALVFPSLAEGFGLPVLEAMACGTAVVTSTAGALPEVAGDAALYCRPDDVEGLAAAMRRILDEPATRAELARRGLERARAHGTEAAGERLAALYLDLFNRP